MSQTLRWPSARMSQKPPKPLKRPRLCTCTTREAEACQVMFINEAKAGYATCIKEAKANCVFIIAEAENCCSMVIRKAESHSTRQAHSIQQSHAKGMQCLETEAIGEEGKYHLSFLATCGAALWASHPKDCGVLVTPFHLLLGMPPVHSTKHSPSIFCPTGSSSFCPCGTWALSPVQMATLLPKLDCIPSSIRSHPKSGPEEPSHLKRRDEMPLHRALTGDQWESFPGFRASAEYERGTLQDKLPTFWSWNLPHPDEHFLEHDHICQSTRFPNLWDPGVLGRAEWAAIC